MCWPPSRWRASRNMCANIAWHLGNLTCVHYASYISYLYWFAASRWRRSWNTRPLCYLDWFSAFKMAWVLEHLGHFATWIGSPPSRWWGSWNTGATLVPGLVLRPQDGVGPGTPGPLCYLDGLAALKMAGVLEYVGHQGGRNRQQQGDNHHACTRCQLFMKLNSKIGIVHNQLATKTLVEFLRNQMVVFCNF